MNITQNTLLAKIAKKVLDNVEDIVKEDHLLYTWMKEMNVKGSDLDKTHFFHYFSFIKPVWESLFYALQAKKLFVEDNQQREGLACHKESVKLLALAKH